MGDVATGRKYSFYILDKHFPLLFGHNRCLLGAVRAHFHWQFPTSSRRSSWAKPAKVPA